ncbi:VOC family protein [Gemmatimonadota bacterium]
MTIRYRLSRAATITGLLAIMAAGCARSGEGDQVNPYRDFGITANNAFFYYDDLEQATRFYTRTLGLRVIADYGFAKILQIADTSYLTLVDGLEGMHTTDEPKTVAIALLTDQLAEWYEYLLGEDIGMRSGYTPIAGRPHHGFVAYDPEGYLLEFERFNPHPENENLIPLLEQMKTLYPDPEQDTDVPPGLGFKGTVLWLYYKDTEGILSFYEDTMGFDRIVDQGWAWIHQTSPTGFIGPVDETRGMHSWTENKAVTVSFFTDDLEGWYSHVKDTGAFELRSMEDIEDDEAGRFRAFVGYDPEGYFLEFDTFLPHALNGRLLESLSR